MRPALTALTSSSPGFTIPNPVEGQHLEPHLGGWAAAEHWVVAGQLVELTIEANLLIGSRFLGLTGNNLTRATGITLVDAAVGVEQAVLTRASVHGALESALVRPALKVVTMNTVADAVTLSVYPFVEVFGSDLAVVVKELEENGKDGDGVRLGADPAVVLATGGEGHVALMIS